MNVADVLIDLYGRLPPLCHEAVEGLTPDQLVQPPAPGANTIGWLVWHLARIQDAQIAELIDADQLWVSGDWASRFGLDPDPDNHGYGHTPEQVLQVRPESGQALLDYLAAVDERTAAMLAGLTADDLDRWSTATGIRRSHSACGWSALPTTASNTPARRPMSAA